MAAGADVGQFLRYAVVGLISNGLLYAGYLILTSIGVEAKPAMTVLYVLGVVQTFAFNRRWSFGYGGSGAAAFRRYCTSYLIGYIVNVCALLVFVDWMHFPHQVVQGFVIIFVAVMLFTLQKLWVFRPAETRKETIGP